MDDLPVTSSSGGYREVFSWKGGSEEARREGRGGGPGEEGKDGGRKVKLTVHSIARCVLVLVCGVVASRSIGENPFVYLA